MIKKIFIIQAVYIYTLLLFFSGCKKINKKKEEISHFELAKNNIPNNPNDINLLENIGFLILPNGYNIKYQISDSFSYCTYKIKEKNSFFLSDIYYDHMLNQGYLEQHRLDQENYSYLTFVKPNEMILLDIQFNSNIEYATNIKQTFIAF